MSASCCTFRFHMMHTPYCRKGRKDEMRTSSNTRVTDDCPQQLLPALFPPCPSAHIQYGHRRPPTAAPSHPSLPQLTSRMKTSPWPDPLAQNGDLK